MSSAGERHQPSVGIFRSVLVSKEEGREQKAVSVVTRPLEEGRDKHIEYFVEECLGIELDNVPYRRVSSSPEL